MTRPPVAPPRWTSPLLGAVLHDDGVRHAIVGDLHEEFVGDVARGGAAAARARHARRVAEIVAHAALDALRWRRWGEASSAESTGVPAAPAPIVDAGRVAARAGGGDVAIGALAFGVLALGIVANTALFATVRHAPRPGGGLAASPVLGATAVVLAAASAVAAAVLLCAGPRWLRRRLHRRGAPCVADDRSAADRAVPSA